MPVVNQIPEEYFQQGVNIDSINGSLKSDPILFETYAVETLTDEEKNTEAQTQAIPYFQSTYGYKYNRNGNICQPLKSIGDNKPIDRLIIMILPIANQAVEAYLKGFLFNTIALPSWVEGNAIAELSARVNLLVQPNLSGKWQLTNYSQTFVGNNGRDSIACDSAIVSINFALGDLPLICIAYFMGVYYKTPPPPDANTLNALRTQAYNNMSQISDLRQIKDDVQLQGGLEYYCSKSFIRHFDFDIDENPPDSLLEEGADHAYIARNKKLCSFVNQNDNRDAITDYIEHNVFSGLNMTLPSIKSAALSNMTNEFQRMIQTSRTNPMWSLSTVAKTYKSADPTANPVHEKSVLMYFNRSENAPNGTVVKVTYIYVFTVFYELLPAEARAVKALFILLCNNLAERLKAKGSNRINTIFQTPSSDAVYLKDLLFEYSKQEFKQGFGFDYEGINSKPPDANSSNIKAYPELFHVSTEDVNVKDVEDWLEAEVFRKDGRTFPEFANNAIWEDIRDTAFKCITESCTRPDWWFHTREAQVFEDPAGGVGIKQYAIYVYAKGVMELEDVRVTRTFVYYLGVFCGIAP